MATNEILNAINGIKKSVEAMDQQLESFCTKNDFSTLLAETNEGFQTNSNRITKLYELRKADAESLVQTVAKIVDDKMAACPRDGHPGQTPLEEDRTRAYAMARRSVRLWPVSSEGNDDRGVRNFLREILDMPMQVVESISIEKIT